MNHSSKLLLTISLLVVLGFASTSPAGAANCTLTVTKDTADETLFHFRGSCPAGYQDTWVLRVNDIQIGNGTSGANISVDKRYTAAGFYLATLRCQTGLDYTTCSDTFSIATYATCGAFVQPGQICPPECPIYDSDTNTCKVATSLFCGSICTDETADQCPATCPCKQTIPYKDMYCGNPPPRVTPTPPPGPGPCSGTDIPTGLGCIPTKPDKLVNKILDIAIGVSSGIALLLLISGAFKVLTSSGDPKSMMEGRETITSAIAGLLLILLSVAILNIIGIRILGLPLWD